MDRDNKVEIEIGYRETWNSTTATLFLYVPGVQLRYTGSPFYVPIRRTMMNTLDIYNEKMIDAGASSGHRTRVFRLRGETT